MPIALVNGVRQNFVQIDAPEDGRDDLVAVHGLATNLAFWYGAYAPVFTRRFRVTLIDLRGHGRSEMTPTGYAPGNLARDIAALLDHLRIERAHFLTHSFGAAVALHFACQAPQRVKSLVVADAHLSAVRNADAAPVWLHGRRYQPVLDRYGLDLDTNDPYFGHKLLTKVAQWRVRGGAVPPELTDLVGPLMGSTAPRTASLWLDLMERTSAASEIMGDDALSLERLRVLRCPILAMYGDNSHAKPTGDRLLDVWPHGEFRRVRDAGHFFPASRPAEVIACCERFWDGTFEDPAARHRAGEATRRYFRGDRLWNGEDGWFCALRGRPSLGPFVTAEDARDAVAGAIPAVTT